MYDITFSFESQIGLVMGYFLAGILLRLANLCMTASKIKIHVKKRLILLPLTLWLATILTMLDGENCLLFIGLVLFYVFKEQISPSQYILIIAMSFLIMAFNNYQYFYINEEYYNLTPTILMSFILYFVYLTLSARKELVYFNN